MWLRMLSLRLPHGLASSSKMARAAALAVGRNPAFRHVWPLLPKIRGNARWGPTLRYLKKGWITYRTKQMGRCWPATPRGRTRKRLVDSVEGFGPLPLTAYSTTGMFLHSAQ